MNYAVRVRTRLFASLGAAVVSALAPGGCAHHRATAVQDSRPPTVSPAVRGMDHGLEMWWWVVADAPPVRSLPDPKQPKLEAEILAATPAQLDAIEKGIGSRPDLSKDARDYVQRLIDQARAAGAAKAAEADEKLRAAEPPTPEEPAANTPVVQAGASSASESRPDPASPKDAAKKTPGRENAAKKGAEPERIHYVVKDSRARLEDVLRPYLDRPVPISDELRERWRVCGLRMIAVPTADLGALEKTLRTVGPVQRQWLGEVPRWMDLVNGPEFEAGWCAGEDGIVQTPAGHVSLLGRCWSGPSGGGGAAMRLELAPQIVPAATGVERFESALEPRKKAEEAGEVLTRLAAGFAWAGPDALVIVPERADVDWKEDGEAEPAMLPVRTLGELMLSTPATEKRGRTRAVIVLIPHAREKFELLP
jgi:hypothetical protein